MKLCLKFSSPLICYPVSLMPSEKAVSLSSLGDPFWGGFDFEGHISEFDREVYNLIWNRLEDSLTGNTQSASNATDEEDAYLVHEREEFTYALYFLGLMTLLENRLAKIAGDVFLTLGLVKDVRAIHSVQESELKIFEEKKTNENEAAFRTEFTKALMKGGQADDDGLFEKVFALKCLRDLIVHPKSFTYHIDENGELSTLPTRQQAVVTKTFPGVIDEHARIHISKSLVHESVEDARKVLARIVEGCQYDYLYLLQEDSPILNRPPCPEWMKSPLNS